MSGYSSWINGVTELMGGIAVLDATSPTPTNDADFNQIYPSIIADAEGLMYRDPDLDFLQTRAVDNTATTSSGVRMVSIPSQFLIIEQAILQVSGTRVNLSRVSVEWVNDVYPVQTFMATPVYGQSYYAIFNGSEIIVAPTPDASYPVEFYGVATQPPLSATNTNTVLTNFYADLFLSASMIFTSGYMKNFSAAGADNPPQAISWKSHYEDLKRGAAFVSARQKYLARGPYPPLVIPTQSSVPGA